MTRSVLFVINSLSQGGAERSTVLLASKLGTLGYEPTIVTLHSSEGDLPDLAATLGVKVVELTTSGAIRQAIELHRMIKETRPDIVHTALFNADQVGRVASIGTSARVISSFVNTPYDPARLNDPAVHRWKLELVRMIDAVTGRLFVDRFHAVSEGVKKANCAAIHVRPTKVTVAERGRDMDPPERDRVHRCSARRALGIDDHAVVILNLGRQEHQKGQVDLVRAVSLLRAEVPAVQLLVAGREGNATVEIRSLLADDPSLDEYVHFLGHRTDVNTLLTAADILMISSKFEGTSGAAIEAMAAGLPIVSTDLVGLQGILADDENALITRDDSPEAMAARLAAAIEDPAGSARRAERSRQGFDNRFTLDAAALRIAQLYDRAL